MNVADYLRYRLGKQPSIDEVKLVRASFQDLCVLSADEFGEETLLGWGLWHVVEPYVKAVA